MFCTNCGAQIPEDARFCPGCGTAVAGPPAAAQTAATAVEPETTLWTGRATNKGVPLAVEYVLTNQRLVTRGGLIGKKEEEIELYRIRDVKVKQALTDRPLGIGTVEVYTADATQPVARLQGIKDPTGVKEQIRKAVIEDRRRRGIVTRELF